LTKYSLLVKEIMEKMNNVGFPRLVRSRLRYASRAVAVAACIGVSLTACSTTTGSATTSTGSATTSKVILVGQNAIESGPAATSFPQTEGFEAYLNYINSQGGVNGYTFKSTVQDNAYAATQGVAAQTKLNTQNPFTSFIVGTTIVSAVIPSLKSRGYAGALIGSADGGLIQTVTSPSLEVFGVVPDYAYMVAYDAQFIMQNLKTQSFAYAYEDDSLTTGATKAVGPYVTENGGKIVTSVAIPDTTTNFVTLATKLQSSGAKTVLAWADTPLLASLQKAAVQIGYNPVWVTPFFQLTSGYLSLAGSAANGTYVDGYLPPLTSNSSAVKTYSTWIAKVSPNAVQGGEIGWQSAAAFIAGFREATAGGKTPTAAGLAAGMRTINGTVGLENLNFTKLNWGSTQAAMYQVKNGKFVQVAQPSALPGT
jgi:branched-chain amino acid transport system substrate-binding protein